jgi:hypothetical protein
VRGLVRVVIVVLCKSERHEFMMDGSFVALGLDSWGDLG